jgi:hypothetical protein
VFICPLNIVTLPEIRRLLPYFFDYVYHGTWPNGSRYKASRLLVEAFDLLLSVKLQEDKKGKEDVEQI